MLHSRPEDSVSLVVVESGKQECLECESLLVISRVVQRSRKGCLL